MEYVVFESMMPMLFPGSYSAGIPLDGSLSIYRRENRLEVWRA